MVMVRGLQDLQVFRYLSRSFLEIRAVGSVLVWRCHTKCLRISARFVKSVGAFESECRSGR